MEKFQGIPGTQAKRIVFREDGWVILTLEPGEVLVDLCFSHPFVRLHVSSPFFSLAGCRKPPFHGVRGDWRVSRAGRRSKVHPEPPLDSPAGRTACRTLHDGPAGGPDHHDLIHGATMKPCGTDRPGTGLPRIPAHREPRLGGFSAPR
jgi:hypothetical protein